MLIQEDPGGNDHVARIYAYASRAARSPSWRRSIPSCSRRGKPGYITNDEESSGIIDTSRAFGHGSFLFDAQVHKKIGGPLVEQGQLMLIRVKSWNHVFGEGSKHDD